MPSVYDLKPRFQKLLRPLCANLARAGISANQVTLAAAFLSITEGAAIAATRGAAWSLWLLPPVLFLRMALNAIDGVLAREWDQKTRLGAVLNELGDVVSDVVLYLPVRRARRHAGAGVVGLVVLGIVGEMAGVVAIQIGAERRYDGPFGKSDRALFFAALAIAARLRRGTRPMDRHRARAGRNALAALTVFNRARAALKRAAR